MRFTQVFLLFASIVVEPIAQINPTLHIPLKFEDAVLLPEQYNHSNIGMSEFLDKKFNFNIFAFDSELPEVLAIHGLFGKVDNYDISNYWYLRTIDH